MKLLVKLSAAALIAVASLSASAQSTTIVYGRTTIQFNSDFQQSLAGLGASITDLNQRALVNGANTFAVKEGAIDLRTASGEVMHSGGYLVSASGIVIKLQNPMLDTTNPTAPVISVLFVVNDSVVGRVPMFLVQPPSGMTLPLQPQSGIEQITGFSLYLAPAGVTAINNVFGGPVLQALTPVGTADVYTVLASAANSDL